MARNTKGQWQPGQSGNPNGRPARAHEEETLNALRASFPATRIISILENALQIAEAQKSSRGMLAVVMEVLDRTQGKPIAATPLAQTNAIDEALRRMAEMEEQTEQKEIEAMLHKG